MPASRVAIGTIVVILSLSVYKKSVKMVSASE